MSSQKEFKDGIVKHPEVYRRAMDISASYLISLRLG
jgi:hypothetical protein